MKLINEQQVAANALSIHCRNVKKLSMSARTEETVSKYWDLIDSTWSQMLSLHQDIIATSDTPPQYQAKFEESKKIAYQAFLFVKSHFPKLTVNSNYEDPDVIEEPIEDMDNIAVGGRKTPQPSNYDGEDKQIPTTDNMAALVELMKIGSEKSMETISELMKANQLMMTRLLESPAPKPKERAMRLPRVELPMFKGDITGYRVFKQSFQNIVRESECSILEKFTLLRSRLEGDALDAIEAIEINDQNYMAAWAILDASFNNQRIILDTNIKNMLNLPKTVSNDSGSILKFLNAARSVERNLSTLRATLDHVEAYSMIQAMDPKQARRFNDTLANSNEIPNKDDIIAFMDKEYRSCMNDNNRAKVEEKEEKRIGDKRLVDKRTFEKRSSTRTNVTQSTPQWERDTKRRLSCFICQGEHSVKDCATFLASNDREDLLRKHKVCIFCLKHRFNFRRPCNSLSTLKCTFPGCNGQHITEMHPPQQKEPASTNTHLTKNESESSSGVILPTALANIRGKDNSISTVRCLVDQCSQSSYVTEDLVQKLQLNKKRTNVKIIGVGGVVTGSVQWIVTLEIVLSDPSLPPIKTKALVVKRVTSKLPAMPTHVDWTKLNKPLSDPRFNRPAHVPILLGSNELPQLFLEGVETNQGLLLQNTLLGWIVSGTAGASTSNITATHVSMSEFDIQLRQFWDLPEPTAEETVDDDAQCEHLFMEKYSRTSEGRYMVPTPWKKDALELGSSFRSALRFFLGQEARWEKNQIHKTMSNAFMKEYISMGHMSQISQDQQRDEGPNTYYIPYISILRKDAVTTKLRNVFNASAKSSNGVTLNDQIHAGPKLQSLIVDIITNVRRFQYVYSADVTKMFRQVLVHPEDRDKLRIIWRASRNDPIMEFRLNTITYGLDCAPWQAIRTLHQIANDNAPDEETRQIIQQSFYMDDLLHGADTIEQCQQQIEKVSKTLEAGCFPLTKWMSNHPDILSNIDPSKQIGSFVDLQKSNNTVKTLGLLFCPSDDTFAFKIKNPPEIKFTKRKLLSMAASLYDPLGWILPAIMHFRILIQLLWEQKYDWDDIVDEKLQRMFTKGLETLEQLESIRIPRWIGCYENTTLELIGFCDASKEGYAAVIYSRVKTNDSFYISLIAAKGRVTPLKNKQTVENNCTIPKLELEGIVLLISLFKDNEKNFHQQKTTFRVYTDSEVALAWVRNAKAITNKFVQRRVNKIRQVIKPVDIHYVKSAENPADPASRGLTPELLVKCKLWFEGPEWLKTESLPTTPLREELTITHVAVIVPEEDTSFIDRASNWNRLRRTIVYVQRWRTKNHGPISSQEIASAEVCIIRKQQQQSFKEEIKTMNNKKPLPAKHWLTTLYPFIDEHGILRVGGRLEHASMHNWQKHPILLVKCHLSDLIIRQTHHDFGHSGANLTERLIRDKYWIPSIKNRIKKCVRQCVVCVRWRARTNQPVMADLPPERVNPAPIFGKIGVDLCGPFHIKASKLKFDKVIKVWVAVFICLVSKAVHLEICFDLSTEKFLEAFTRFVSRRGCPSMVMSDNGTNFRGSARKIKEQWDTILKSSKDQTAIQNIEWIFIPTYSPTFGGLWEAAVKSLKYFAKRMANIEHLTPDEFNTLLCKIEAILNSRPMYPNSSDPEAEPALTPFHFTIQRGFRTSPDNATNDVVPATKKWLSINQIQTQFWERFKNEYLTHLQKRYKWKHATKEMIIGDVVIIQEPWQPPTAWKLGRIIEKYPDSKGVSRRYDVSTSSEVIHCPGKRLVPLLEEEEDKKPQVCEQNDNTEEEEPALRRSKRIQTRTTTLLTRTILWWLTITSVVNAVTIQTLGPGTHVQRLGSAYVKAFDLGFSVVTSLNITTDQQNIDNHVKEFRDFCASIQQTEFTSIYSHCMAMETTVKNEANTAIDSIHSMYTRTRPKRTLAIAGVAVKAAVKFAPHILLGAGMVYQAVQNHRLEEELKGVKHKMVTISQLMLNLTEIEYAAVDHELSQLIIQQRQILMEEQINDYAASITALIATYQTMHQNIVNIRPIEELTKAIDNINKNLTIFALPPLDIEALFTYHPIQKTIDDSMVVVHFNIIVVRADIFTEYVIISIPSYNKAITMKNGEPVQKVILNGSNKTMCFSNEADRLTDRIFDNVRMRPIDPCLNEIIKMTNNSLLEPCISKVKTTNTTQIFMLSKDLAVILEANRTNTSINCGHNTEFIQSRAVIVQFPDCSLFSNNESITADTTAEISMELNNAVEDLQTKPVDIIIQEVKQKEDSNKIKQLLTQELADPKSWMEEIPWIHISWATMMIFLVIIIVAFSCLRNRRPVKQPTWAQEWFVPDDARHQR